MPSFLTPEDIAELHQVFDDGMETLKAFNRTPIVVTFIRMDEQSGVPIEEETVELISLTFGLREGMVTGQQGGIVQTYADGDMLLHADGYIPSIGERFEWQGFWVRVTKVFPPDQGVVSAEVDIQQVAA